MATAVIEVEGHIIDSLLLPKILDTIVDAGADYRIVDVQIGRTSADTSRSRLEIAAETEAAMDALLETLAVHGANRVVERESDAATAACERDGVLPQGFYSTTNLPTSVRVGGLWRQVENPEMDCGIVIDGPEVRTVPMHRVRAGEEVVVGLDGVRVSVPLQSARDRAFEFMKSDTSSEKPQGVLVARVAEQLRAAHDAGKKVLAVPGPAVIHTGAGPDLAGLVRDGWVDVLFAGNGLAAHDIEASVLGTSLGVSVTEGTATEEGHSNHVRVINEVRRHGSIATAVRAGYLTGGVLYECVRADVPFVLGGSVRDDGPLPDVETDVVAAGDRMRALIPGVGVALILASTLHGIATGNLLPAGVQVYCIDISQAVVTKLFDRGSHQSLGIVTDVGLFLRRLTEELSK